MRTKGKMTFWDDEKGYGFIQPHAGGERVFIHIKAFNNPGRRPDINQVVTFTLSTDKRGRRCAEKAVLAGDRRPAEAQKRTGSLSMVMGVVFFIIIGLLVAVAKIPLFVFIIYLAASLVTFIVYAGDKAAAQKGAWRTPESTLHLLSLIGGWPGALVAQKRLRHKSRKQAFQVVFWITVLMNGVAMYGVLTPTGSTILQTVIANVAKG